MRCVFLCAVLLNSVVVGMSQDDAYPDQVFLNEPAQLALPEGVPIEAVVKARNERIRKEVAALIEKVTKTGVAIPGFKLDDGHFLIQGKFAPHLVPIGFPLEDFLFEVTRPPKNVVAELIARGFPYEELTIIHKYESENSYHNFSIKKYFKDKTMAFNRLKQKENLTDEEINDFYVHFALGDVLNHEAWCSQFLGELSPRARRVFLSYLFEEFTPYMGWGSLIKANAQDIARFRAAPLYEAEGANQ